MFVDSLNPPPFRERFVFTHKVVSASCQAFPARTTSVPDSRWGKGKEWNELLQCFNKRDLKASLKGAYRKTGNEILTIARQRLMSSGIAHASKLKKGIRLRVYSRGGGFMITVKPHGKQGYHVNRFGLEKPVVMWAEEGTKERMLRNFPSDGKRVVRIDGKYRTVGAFTGKMPAYHFLDGVYEQGVQILNRDIPSNLEDSVMKKAGRLGWT